MVSPFCFFVCCSAQRLSNTRAMAAALLPNMFSLILTLLPWDYLILFFIGIEFAFVSLYSSKGT